MSASFEIGDLVPEFAVADWCASLAFYRDVVGFEVAYQRVEERFAFLQFGRAQLMIYEIGTGRVLAVEGAALDRPLGRGMNLQIKVDRAAPLLAALEAAGAPLVLPLEERSYWVGDIEHGVRQFAVADPDGYFLRFSETVSVRHIFHRSPNGSLRPG